MVTKAYLANGKDGYDVLAHCHQLIDEENAPRLRIAVQNHFRALAMREGNFNSTSLQGGAILYCKLRGCILAYILKFKIKWTGIFYQGKNTKPFPAAGSPHPHNLTKTAIF